MQPVITGPPIRPKIAPLGDGALLLEIPSTGMDPELNRRLTSFAYALAVNPIPGFIEAAAAYNSVTVYYDPRKAGYEEISRTVLHRWPHSEASVTLSRLIHIPVLYTGADVENVCATCGITREELVRLHTSRTYRVYMMGFLPGFAYMGEVDERIAAGRHATPRERVPAGSVGIAERQTGIYPLASPGGWQIIGHTSLKLFDPLAEEPTLLRAGDDVQFHDASLTLNLV